MSLFKVFDVAGTAMNAQSIRLNVTASNLANAGNANGDPEKVYRARQPVFSSFDEALQGQPGIAGVRLEGVIESDAPLQLQYQPHHPHADAERQRLPDATSTHGRRNGQHDVGVAFVSEQRRNDQHHQRPVTGNAGAGPLAGKTTEAPDAMNEISPFAGLNGLAPAAGQPSRSDELGQEDFSQADDHAIPKPGPVRAARQRGVSWDSSHNSAPSTGFRR